MPDSSYEGKDKTAFWVSEITPKHYNILDIGTGRGVYSYLFRNKDNLKSCKWTGVEVWEPYVEKYDLKSKYDTVLIEDARSLTYGFNNYDVAFCGDVLEHMKKTEAQHLVHRLLQCCSLVIISIPIIYFKQGPIEGNPHEEHIKADWSHEEVMESFENIIDSEKGNILGVYKLKGLV